MTLPMATLLLLLGLTVSVATLQTKGPPLNVKVTAPTPQKLVLSWEPPDDVVEYVLTCRDVIEDNKCLDVTLGSTITKYTLSDLKSNGSYSLWITWTGKNIDGRAWTATLRPMEVYRSGLADRKRPPAMLIFYGTISGAVLLYFIVVGALICHFWRRRRARSSFSMYSTNRAGKLSSLETPTSSGRETIDRYSRTEDLYRNRVSTFTGGRSVVVQGPPTAPADNGGYERPLHTDYLTPIPNAEQDTPPPLPERNNVAKQQTDPEPQYVDPEDIKLPSKDPKDIKLPSKKQKGKKENAKKKNKGEAAKEMFQSTESLSSGGKKIRPASPSVKVRRYKSMNAAGDRKAMVAIGSPPKSSNTLPAGDRGAATLGEGDLAYACTSLPAVESTAGSNVDAYARSDVTSPTVPMKSKATVQRNESTKSLTIRTEVESQRPAPSAVGVGRDLLQAAAAEGFQITLTLRSKPRANPGTTEHSYDIVQ